jgi:phospholipid/cholesterol/gamma-HCH transport system ATP-binding protein
MGMLFQSGALLTDMNVFDNVAYPIREHTTLPESMIRSLVLIKLQAVGLRGARRLMPNELSGGMARRVALARAIALDPMMIMYDEPFTGQDPISMGALVHLIKALNTTLGLTSIIVSHDVHETSAIADYIYVLSEGKVVGQGTPAQIQQSNSDWVQQFMNGRPDGPVHFHYPAKDYMDDLLFTENYRSCVNALIDPPSVQIATHYDEVFSLFRGWHSSRFYQTGAKQFFFNRRDTGCW